MNISSAFIERPIATSLLMAGSCWSGGGLPAAAGGAAAAGRLPDHPGLRRAARRQPRDHGLVGGAAAGAAVRADPRRHPDDLDAARSATTAITVQFELDRNIDAAAQDIQAAINAASGQLPKNLPDAADLPQGQPGRRADPDHRR